MSHASLVFADQHMQRNPAGSHLRETPLPMGGARMRAFRRENKENWTQKLGPPANKSLGRRDSKIVPLYSSERSAGLLGQPF
jgi:hypothetical protein